MIDTHTHLDLITTDQNEIKQIVQKCKTSKITALFNISVDFTSNFSSRNLAEKIKEIYFTAGLHPSEADNYNDNQLDKIADIFSDKKCIGIGEIGIDLYKNYSKQENQMELFEKFLALAKKYNKPVIIHSRNAFKEIFNFIGRNEYKSLKGIFHCFSYDYDKAKKCVDAGYMISFAGNLTFKNAYKLHEVAKKIPLEYILCETDSPFLAPVPVRGKKNYPYNLVHIINFLSNIRHLPMENVIKQLDNNIKSLFKIKI